MNAAMNVGIYNPLVMDIETPKPRIGEINVIYITHLQIFFYLLNDTHKSSNKRLPFLHSLILFIRPIPF